MTKKQINTILSGRAFGQLKETATRIRTGEGSYDRNRRYQPGTETREAFDCRSQPLSARAQAEVRDNTPAGIRYAEMRRFWVNDAAGDFLIPGKPSGEGADQIEYRGIRYRVVYVVDFSDKGYIEAVAARPDEG